MATIESSFVKREPAVVGAVALAVVQYVVRALLTHGIIGSSVATSLTQQLDPLVTGVLIVVAGFVLRHFVTPAAAKVSAVEADVAKVLHLDESTISKLNAALQSVIGGIKVDGKKIATLVEGGKPKPDDPPAVAPAATTPTPIITGGGALTFVGPTATSTTTLPVQPAPTPQPTQAEAVAAAQPVQPANQPSGA